MLSIFQSFVDATSFYFHPSDLVFCHLTLFHWSAAYPEASLGQTHSFKLDWPHDLWHCPLVSSCLYERQGS